MLLDVCNQYESNEEDVCDFIDCSPWLENKAVSIVRPGKQMTVAVLQLGKKIFRATSGP